MATDRPVEIIAIPNEHPDGRPRLGRSILLVDVLERSSLQIIRDFVKDKIVAGQVKLDGQVVKRRNTRISPRRAPYEIDVVGHVVSVRIINEGDQP